ncbi:hypothetical protein SLEP1_g4484 [Rubroshorea leprosula]|uniref:Proteolipid membrane potential modulator n=1 Tax=Rubroshorea leprosula TaxID=152421 RepID=A0AAV5HWJ5_9ROSI|nr:hypothetical protein SLEP1_g4484 [Rubroshorea leprosula]
MCFTIKCDCFKCDCGGDGGCIDFTLALFLPPVAVLKRRGVVKEFWISVCLTMACFVPGSLYAVNVVKTKD